MNKKKKITELPQSKEGKYSSRLSDVLSLGQHESFRIADNFYRLLVESLTGYGIFTTDKKGNISSWNGGAQKLFGYTEKDIIGENASIIFRQEDINHTELQKQLKKATKKGKVSIERYHVRKDSSLFWASGLIFSLGDEDNIARGFTFIIRDLTDIMELGKRKDSFISTASHELRTPITSMKLYAQIIEQEIKKTGSGIQLESVVELNNQLNKFITLMDYLLDVAKIQKEKLELEKNFFDMDELIEEVMATIQIVSSKHLITRQGGITEKVYGDRSRIGQILANLIGNAIKYSPTSDKVIVTSGVEKNDVVVAIKDFGYGILKSEQSGIFSRFYRAKSAVLYKIEGIGLGLYVAQQIAKAHGGKITLESDEGNGSTFYIKIPRNLKTKNEKK